MPDAPSSPPPPPTLLANAVGSALAGIITRLFTHPLDTAKSRLQAPGSPYQGPLEVLAQTLRSEGIPGLYRGLGAVVVGGTPGTMIYLCSYDLIKERLSSDQSNQFLVHFAAGMLAETLACTIYVPVDVIKERLQVQSLDMAKTNFHYRNTWDAVRKIARYEGLSGLYRGFPATLGSFGPFSALYFVFYEDFKQRAIDVHHQTTQELPFTSIVVCSAAAGALASWLTSPLDMAKLRLQIQRGLGEETTTNYRGALDCLRQTYHQGGLQGLFRGSLARVLHFAPATAISMSTYETCRNFATKFIVE